MEQRSSTYRADIDGLRAVAVVLVVLFHAGVAGFDGGFVGVDVFFVISGYLITRLLIAELDDTGRIDFRSFYARRARRLFPMMGVVVAASLVAGVFILVPDPSLRWLSQSTVGVSAFLSNVFFMVKTRGYFGATAETLPLLNTWSLAVEEQFYLVWPLLLLVAWRVGKRSKAAQRAALIATIGVVAASFVLAVVLVRWNRSYAFYLMPARLWELAAGGALVLVERRWANAVARLSGGISGLLGLVAIAASVVLLDSSSAFPGVAAVPAVAGTCMLIVSGGAGSRLRTVLSWPTAVYVGRVSYSWYLLHWPALVFVRVMTAEEHLGRDLLVVAGTFGLAMATHRYIESPIRAQRVRWVRGGRGAIAVSALSLLVPAALGVVVLRDVDAVSQLSLSDSERAALAENRTAREACPNLPSDSVEVVDCSFPGRSSRRLVLAGDSHALALLPLARQLAAELGVGLDVLWDTACPYVVGYDPPDGSPDVPEKCVGEGERNLAYLEANADELVGVLSTARASSYVAVGADGEPSPAESAWSDALRRALAPIAAAGVPVVVMHDVPHFQPRVVECLIRRGVGCGVDETEARESRGSAFDAEKALSEIGGVTLWDPFAAFCTAGRCEPSLSGQVLYRDSTHLSEAGARHLAAWFLPFAEAVFAV